MATAIDSIEEILQGNSVSTLSLFSLMTAAGYDAAVSAVRSNITAARENISNQDALLFKSSAAQLDGNFKREILMLAPTKKLLTYYETQVLFVYRVLEEPDLYFNDNILGKFFRRDFDI